LDGIKVQFFELIRNNRIISFQIVSLKPVRHGCFLLSRPVQILQFYIPGAGIKWKNK